MHEASGHGLELASPVPQNRSGALLCGHGSRDPRAAAEFASVAASLRQRLPDRAVEIGYLEFQTPTIVDGLAALQAGGARRITVLPAMLSAGSHMRTDIPAELERFGAANPGVELALARDLGFEPRLLAIAAARIDAADRQASHAASRAETALVVVGRGAGEPELNAETARNARLLAETMGFGWSAVAFAGTAQPSTEAALDRVARLGFPRILVFPYLLFSGILVARVQAAVAAAAERHPQLRFLAAAHLGPHPSLVESFLDRLAEAEPVRLPP